MNVLSLHPNHMPYALSKYHNSFHGGYKPAEENKKKTMV